MFNNTVNNKTKQKEVNNEELKKNNDEIISEIPKTPGTPKNHLKSLPKMFQAIAKPKIATEEGQIGEKKEKLKVTLYLKYLTHTVLIKTKILFYLF